MNLPAKLRSPRKRPINIKNKDKKCLLWCHVRHITPSKEHPERFRKIGKKNLLSTLLIQKKLQKKIKFISDLDYDGIESPLQEKDFSKIEVKNNTCINVFGYEDELVFPIYDSDQNFED